MASSPSRRGRMSPLLSDLPAHRAFSLTELMPRVAVAQAAIHLTGSLDQAVAALRFAFQSAAQASCVLLRVAAAADTTTGAIIAKVVALVAFRMASKAITIMVSATIRRLQQARQRTLALHSSSPRAVVHSKQPLAAEARASEALAASIGDSARQYTGKMVPLCSVVQDSGSVVRAEAAAGMAVGLG